MRARPTARPSPVSAGVDGGLGVGGASVSVVGPRPSECRRRRRRRRRRTNTMSTPPPRRSTHTTNDGHLAWAHELSLGLPSTCSPDSGALDRRGSIGTTMADLEEVWVDSHGFGPRRTTPSVLSRCESASATVDREHDSGDEPGLVGGQEQRGVRRVPRRAHAARAAVRAGCVPPARRRSATPRAAAMPPTAIGVSTRPSAIALQRTPATRSPGRCSWSTG